MHFDDTRIGGTWMPAFVPTATDWERLDVKQFKSINGDDGGTWAPTSPIIIGGQGLQLGNSSALWSGLQTSLGGRLILGANDFVAVKTGGNPWTRTLTFPLVNARGATLGTPGTLLQDNGLVTLTQSPAPLGLQIAGGITGSVYVPVPGRYIHNGGTLTKIKLWCRVRTRPTSLPTFMIASMIAVDYNGAQFSNTQYSQFSGSWTQWASGTSFALNSYVVPTSANTNGYYFKATSVSGTHTSGGSEPTWPTVPGNTVTDNPGGNQIVWTNMGFSGQLWASTVDGYYAGGAARAVEFDCDPAVSVTSDISTKKYILALATVDPNVTFHSLQLTFGSISSMAFE